MKRLIRAAATVAAFLAASCAARMTVSSHVQPGLDFGQYRVYDWGPADALPTGDARLDRDPFFQDHVQGEIEKQLAGKGFERASAAGSADLLIHYHASITRRIDVNRTDSEYGYCADENCAAKVNEFEAGTLILDILDARTNRLIWRGWAQRALGDELENRDHLARQIDEAVTRMLARFRPL